MIPFFVIISATLYEVSILDDVVTNILEAAVFSLKIKHAFLDSIIIKVEFKIKRRIKVARLIVTCIAKRASSPIFNDGLIVHQFKRIEVNPVRLLFLVIKSRVEREPISAFACVVERFWVDPSILLWVSNRWLCHQMHLEAVDAFSCGNVREKRENDDCNGIANRNVSVIFTGVNANGVTLRPRFSNTVNFERSIVSSSADPDFIKMPKHSSHKQSIPVNPCIIRKLFENSPEELHRASERNICGLCIFIWCCPIHLCGNQPFTFFGSMRR